MQKQNSNHIKKGGSYKPKQNSSFDLWAFEGGNHFENDKANEEIYIFNKNKYKPQHSIPSKGQQQDKKKQLSSVDSEPYLDYPKKHNIKRTQTSVPKKPITNLNFAIPDYNPDQMVKFLKNKFMEASNLPVNNDMQSQQKIKKSNKEIESIGANLYQKKVLSNDYEMQRKIKQMTDEQKNQQEMAECTFKPQLCPKSINDRSKKNPETKKNLYEQQNKWLDSVNSKNEKNYEKKMNNELKDCSFCPQTRKMPNFEINNNQPNGTTELYYMRVKNARKLSQEKIDKVDYAKKYDNRRKKEGNNRSMRNFDMNNISEHISQSQPGFIQPNNQEHEMIPNANPYIDNDFEMKKNQLMQELHGWNNENNNTENDDDFF